MIVGRVSLKEGDIVVTMCDRVCFCIGRVISKRVISPSLYKQECLFHNPKIGKKDLVNKDGCHYIKVPPSASDGRGTFLLFRGKHTKRISGTVEKIVKKRGGKK